MKECSKKKKNKMNLYLKLTEEQTFSEFPKFKLKTVRNYLTLRIIYRKINI